MRALFYIGPARLVWSLVLTLIALVAIHIPLLNIPIILVTFPLFELFPEFAKTGPDVGWHDYGLFLKSSKAFVFFGTYHYALSFLMTLPIGWTATSDDRLAAGIEGDNAKLL